jgi:hypothetical protein
LNKICLYNRRKKYYLWHWQSQTAELYDVIIWSWTLATSAGDEGNRIQMKNEKQYLLLFNCLLLAAIDCVFYEAKLWYECHSEQKSCDTEEFNKSEVRKYRNWFH